jgi:hypothetical protein
MVGMCSMMMGMAIAFLGIAWFAARRVRSAAMVSMFAIPAVLGAAPMLVAPRRSQSQGE